MMFVWVLFFSLLLRVRPVANCGPKPAAKTSAVMHVHQHQTEGNSQEGGFHIMEIHVGTVSWTIGGMVAAVLLIVLAIYLYLRWRRRAVRQDENRRLRSWAFSQMNPWRQQSTRVPQPLPMQPLQQAQPALPPPAATEQAQQQPQPFPNVPVVPFNMNSRLQQQLMDNPPDYKPSFPPGI